MLLRAQRFIAWLARQRLLLTSGILLAGCPVLHCATTSAVSIKSSEYLPVNGAQLYLLIRGSDRTAPVLLWLHGGPGGAERPLFRYFNSELEKHFVVVYWDQRGAGRSFDPKADLHRLTIALHLADLDVVVNHLRESLGQDKVILIGHSWGAALGLLSVQAHPGKVSGFIGVNPLISVRAAEEAEDDFILKEGSQHKDADVLEHARKIGRPPFESAEEGLAIEKLVQHYGGIFHKEPDRLWAMFGPSLPVSSRRGRSGASFTAITYRFRQ